MNISLSLKTVALLALVATCCAVIVADTAGIELAVQATMRDLPGLP